MSHYMGVKCEDCGMVLLDDHCPECHPRQGHGYDYIDSREAETKWGHHCPAGEEML